jgi:hypothetical protein
MIPKSVKRFSEKIMLKTKRTMLQKEEGPGLATEAFRRTGRCRVSAPTASRIGDYML